MAIFGFVFFSGCEIAVSPPENSSFNIEGNIKSEIYPVSVKQDGEDLYVQLKDHAPDVEMSSIDLNQTTSFNYKREGDRLIIPGKFKHIRLHSKGSEDIDIVYKMAAA